MKYDDVRGKIQSGDLLLWTHKSWKSWYDFKIQVVRIVTQSEYSHAGIAWVVGGRVFILEAVMPKVRIFPLSKELPFYWIPMNKPLSEHATEFALEQVGEPYSVWRAIIAFIFGLPQEDENQWECAEYACKVLAENGIDLGRAYTPSKIAQAALEADYKLEYVEVNEPLPDTRG